LLARPAVAVAFASFASRFTNSEDKRRRFRIPAIPITRAATAAVARQIFLFYFPQKGKHI